MTAAAYSGLAIVGVIGSPLIVAGALFGGPPYLAYRAVKARRARVEPADTTAITNPRNDYETMVVRAGRARAAARGILQPEELYSQDGDFGSGSTRFTSLSDAPESHAESQSSSGVILRRVRGPQRVTEVASSRGGSTANISSVGDSRSMVQVQLVEAPETSDAEERVITGDMPSVSMDSCRVARPVVLERRRGSAGSGPIAKRSVA